ncbi:MAG: SDR family oxidoreductase, partial [Thermomicrobiales bacterium]
MAQTPAEAFSLAGRVAIVTGAGGGLGHGICDSLAAAGATVVAAGRTRESLDDTVALVTGNGGTAVARVCDISNEADIAALMRSVAEEFGRIDILINNAAIYPRREWTEITAESWDEVMATNLKGYFLCSQAAFPYLKANGTGRIINIASITFFGGWSMLL